MGLVKKHYFSRTIKDIPDRVYESISNFAKNCSPKEEVLKIRNEAISRMPLFFRMLFDNEIANVLPHYIKSMNINIYACVLLSQLDFNSFDKCFSEKLDTFSIALSDYAYHKYISIAIRMLIRR